MIERVIRDLPDSLKDQIKKWRCADCGREPEKYVIWIRGEQ